MLVRRFYGERAFLEKTWKSKVHRQFLEEEFMKKSFFLVIAILDIIVGRGAVQAQQRNDLIIAVLNFRNTGKDTATWKHLGAEIAESFITDLAHDGKLLLVERFFLPEIIRELYVRETEHFQTALRNERGKLRGANIALVGSFSVNDNKKTITIRLRFVCVGTGTVLFSENTDETKPLKKLAELCKKMAKILEQRLVECKDCEGKCGLSE